MKRVILFGLFLVLCACQTVHDRSSDYTHAKSTDSLSLPDGVSDSQFSESFVIPAPANGDVTPISLVPPGMNEDIKEYVK